MIHGVFGKLGSGKGLLVMDIISKELLEGFRDVVTNVPLRLLPWVNGQGLPQIGLRAYLQEKLPELVEEEIDEILKRVHVIEDIDLGHDLFMWRRDGDTGEWFKLTVTKDDEKGRPERFDAEEIKIRRCAPVLCVTDEAWQFYTNSGGWARVPLLAFYARQQRKLRDEWYIVTQHPSDVDVMLWNIAQDFWVCRNHGMERLGMFRQPSMFRVIIYLTNPAKGNAIRSREMYHRLDKKLSQCYDTTAGVGIAGGFKGDSNQKKSGLHIGWLAAAIVLLVAVLACTPIFLGKGSSAWLRHLVDPKQQNVKKWSGQTNNVQPSVRPLRSLESSQAQAAPGETARTNALLPVVKMTGYAGLPGPAKMGPQGFYHELEYRVFLSDGTDYTTGDGHLQYLCPKYCVVDGRTNWMQQPEVRRQNLDAPISPVLAGVPVQTAPMQAPVASYDPPQSTLVIIPQREFSIQRPAVRSVSGNNRVSIYGN